MKNSNSAFIATGEETPDSFGNVEYILISSVEEAKFFFGPIALEERKWRSSKYFDPLQQSPRSKLGIGEHDRAEAYIFGDGSFPKIDTDAHHSHFPVSVKVLRIEELFLAPNELIDLSARSEEFPWDTDDSEIYLVVTVKRLVLSRQSKIVVKGNVFILNCEEAVANNLYGGHAMIELGVSDLVQQRSFTRVSPINHEHRNGVDGISGADGPALNVESTPLGIRVVNDGGACKGGDGTDGANGLKGMPGRNGAMLYLADLRFRQLSGFEQKSIYITAEGGAGFPGTNGGDGGNGGHGGKGTDGIATPFGMVAGFSGGSGGGGGDGGNGGKGGNGGLCCDIFVSIPSHHSQVFHSVTFPAKGGIGGKGGQGGKGGLTGVNGHLHVHSKDSQNGKDGQDGVNGADGKTRAAPKIHIYEPQ